MALKEKITHWYTTEREKLRPMSPLKRVQYIFTYYKSWMLGFLAAVVLAALLGEAALNRTRETVLQGFMINDSWMLFPAKVMEQEFGERMQLTGKQQLLFDDALYIDMGGNANEYTEASNARVLATVTTAELDVIISTEEVKQYYDGNLPMKDLAQILPPKAQQVLADQMIYTTDDKGETICTGIDMTASKFIAGIGADTDPAIKDVYVLFAPRNGPHEQALAEFICYCFDLPRE